MLKIAIILGTRPEAIKYAPVINAMKNDSRFETIVVSTGQHREMLDEALSAFDIKPDYDLCVMTQNQTLSQIASRITDNLADILSKIKPDAITVHGDTGTTLAAAISGFHHQIPVIHIEAGLRSGTISSPFPEEGNRKLVAQIASLHLAPTLGNAANLIREGVPENRIVITGNTVVDALNWALKRKIIKNKELIDEVRKDNRKVILASAHRRESRENLSDIAKVIKDISSRKDVRIIIPMHKNPKIRNVLRSHLSDIDNISLIEPLNYIDFCHLMNSSDVILSDSSGAEEEGATLGKPTLIIRNLTERPEATYDGSAILVGNSYEKINKNLSYILDNLELVNSKEKNNNRYGDGLATERVIGAIANFFNLGPAVQPFYSSCSIEVKIDTRI